MNLNGPSTSVRVRLPGDREFAIVMIGSQQRGSVSSKVGLLCENLCVRYR